MAYNPFTLLSLIFFLFGNVHGYIPATPTNDTAGTSQGIGNATTPSNLHIQWYSGGTFSQTVTYQLVGSNSSGITQGAVVHFAEEYATNDTTTTPWIAMIACDYNATNASMEFDIFTLAHDRGAQSAILFSNYSQGCVINPEYADPHNFDQVMDIFSVQSLPDARVLEYQFGQFGYQNETLYGYFNPGRLSASAGIVNQTIQSGNPVAPGYLFATLRAFNATGVGNITAATNTTSTPASGNSGHGTGLAMIILYAITGCVSALFCAVIISGAIRAIRHPERYGPRTGNRFDLDGYGQSRARGLGRAILDTFPVVKFGSGPVGQQEVKDIEAQIEGTNNPDESHSNMMEMGERNVTEDGGDLEGSGPGVADADAVGMPADTGLDEVDVEPAETSSRDALPRVAGTKETVDGQGKHEVMPDAIGRETCPICIVDFEEGDDLRVLPCEGNHRFHQSCVDPWLLELSSSCPICRQDFHALETMLYGEVDEESSRQSRRYSRVNRFSRYVRFARLRRDRRREEDPMASPQD